MTRVAFSEAAIADLRDIWLYSAETWGVSQADRYTDEIEATCRDLAVGRKAGRKVAERPGYVRFPIARHLILFKERDGGIVVMRILHQRMDIERHL